MSNHVLTKLESQEINPDVLISEMIKIVTITPTAIILESDDSLGLSSKETELQDIINSHTGQSVKTVIISMAEILGALVDDATLGAPSDQMILISQHSLMGVLQSLGCYQTGLQLSGLVAKELLDALETANLIGADSKASIKSLIESKGIVFPT